MAKRSVSKKQNIAGTILHELLQVIFKDLQINQYRFHYFLESYLQDPVNAIPQNRKDITSARGNIVKEINQTSITWLMFTRALKIIRANRFTITITIHHNDSESTSHSVGVDLGRSFIKDDSVDMDNTQEGNSEDAGTE